MKFKQKQGYDEVLVARSDQGVDIEVLFNGEEPGHVYVDGVEFSASCDTLAGLYVATAGTAVSLAEIVRRAAVLYESLLAEDAEDARLDREMARELSCPYLTGRV